MVPGGFFPTNPDLAVILGDMDFDFENSYFLDLFGSQISGFGPAWTWLIGPGLGPACARLGTCLGPSGGPSNGPWALGWFWGHE